MLDFLFTSYTLNSLFYVAHQQKLLNLVASPSTLSSATGQVLQLNCPTNSNNSNCIGRIFSNTTFGPEAYIMVTMSTAESPKAAFNFGEAYWLGQGKTEMTVVDGFKKTLLFSANISCVSSALLPRIYNNT